jgi:FKBP-type peptidyl-prolyl cis-trans isomerase 2
VPGYSGDSLADIFKNTGRSKMPEAKKGDTVKVHYTGKFDDGTVFDSSQDREPLVFMLGEGSVIPAFEQAVEGMNPGEVKTETIPADQAYGPRLEEMVTEVDKKLFPPNTKLEAGQMLQIPREEGKTLNVTITKVSEDKVTLDANHPLAGKDLIFNIELVEIEK